MIMHLIKICNYVYVYIYIFTVVYNMLCCFHVLFGKRLSPPKLFIGPSQQKSSHLTCNTLAKALSAALWLV